MNMWKNKKVLVLGMGSTGLSMAGFFREVGADVSVYDAAPDEAKLARLASRADGVSFPVLSGSLAAEDVAGIYDILALSPGFGRRLPFVEAFAAAGGAVTGDVDILSQLLHGSRSRMIAVTGANGKTTTTELVGFLCTRCGWDTVVAGNIGKPVLDAWRERKGQPADVWVLELSSFQLETVGCLNATAAAVLNISEDHLDRYEDLLDYAHAKDRIFRGNGVQVLNADDLLCRAMVRHGRVAKYFSVTEKRDYFLDGDLLFGEAGPLMNRADIPLQGRHNIANVLAALALCEAAGLPREELVRQVPDFRGPPHRVEKIADIGGVAYIDDSKGTNVGATAAALAGLDNPVVLIAGGQGKGQDFSPLRPVLAGKARAVFLIGEDGGSIAAALTAADYPVEFCPSLEKAVTRAFEVAVSGDAVLLSPACASFDMFEGYAHRSAVFAQAVNRLQERSS